ncbi:MAG TPA: AtpZ/AtpI family protein [Candidatus Acidoferrum sp.]
MADPPDYPPRKQPLTSFARYSEIGFIIPACVLLGLLFGKLADYWLHTHWLYVAGIIFGAVVGFWQMIRMAVGAFKKDE